MERINKRLYLLNLIVFIAFIGIIIKLIQLQLINKSENIFLAENNRVRREIVQPPRGIILDRHGEKIAFNTPQYFEIDNEGKKKIIERDEALLIQAEKKDQKLKKSYQRIYPDKELFGHLLGYLGEISEEELKKEKLDIKGYSIGSFMGRMGIEAQYEEILRGREGTNLIEVDTTGEIVRKTAKIFPDPGKTLTLSVDKQLQEVAENQLRGKKGTVIATNPQNGEVLVLFSSPSFDPNYFLDKDKQKEVYNYFNDNQNLPLLNRAISGLYPPGSTYKIVTSIAGLEEGKITPQTTILDTGVISLGGSTFSNWFFTSTGGTEGEVNLKKALARSVDTYYYKVGEKVGIDNLVKWSKIFGLDEKFGIDLPGEVESFIATPEWKKRVKKEDWYLGNTYHMSIGQGDLLLTPLGVNMMTSVVANKGNLCRPSILHFNSPNTLVKPECKELPINKEYLKEVEKGLIAVCSSGGTAGSYASEKFTSACKTGTAEIGLGIKTHAWFTIYAPIENPEIAVTVLVENGGEGSSVSSPIAKEILRKYFEGK